MRADKQSSTGELPSGMAAVVATKRFRRRLFQFSLQTLLIATLLVALGLGWYTSRFELERRAVAAIEALGGRCEFDD